MVSQSFDFKIIPPSKKKTSKKAFGVLFRNHHDSSSSAGGLGLSQSGILRSGGSIGVKHWNAADV
jgi:hypothetical protein